MAAEFGRPVGITDVNDVTAGDVAHCNDAAAFKADLIVLDPPRSGAGKHVLAGILRMRPRKVLYVACDPSSLARDIALARDLHYVPTALEAVDAFPHTAHVETFALLEPK